MDKDIINKIMKNLEMFNCKKHIYSYFYRIVRIPKDPKRYVAIKSCVYFR